MADSLISEKAPFNYSMFQENQANPWKFLEELHPDIAQEAGFLVNSPVPVITLTSLYILFVCAVGPFLMRFVEPFQLKTVIRFYNLLMVFVAGLLLFKLHNAVESVQHFFDCSKTFSFSDSSASKIYGMANFILLVRISEYMDTIFFTLRKKQNQVTFLHVFHHAFVPMYAYWILRTAPMRFNVFIICVNSFIHVLMYFYYFLATFQQPRDQTSGAGNKKQPKQSFIMMIVMKLLMFKKYMTQLQILQFISLAIYAIWAAFQPNRCQVPWTYIIANILLALGFLGLFLHFYINVYKVAAANRKSGAKRE